jgi:hypothetical protein
MSKRHRAANNACATQSKPLRIGFRRPGTPYQATLDQEQTSLDAAVSDPASEAQYRVQAAMDRARAAHERAQAAQERATAAAERAAAWEARAIQ